MSIALLKDVYRETRRLAIAGSVVAPGDFRLQKLVEPLRQLGEKAPVFSRVAECVERVVAASEQTAAAALLELGALISSILYTQGSVGADGELQPIAPSTLTLRQTKASSRVIKQILEALTTTGSGRLEKIVDAHQRGLLHDLRLVRPLLRSIDDVYGGVGEFVAEQVLPTFGSTILPDLIAEYDPNGKSGHGRRLKLIYHIDPTSARPLVERTLEEGSKENKVIAIQFLGDAISDLPFLLEQSKARAFEVRRAALLALSRMSSAEASDQLTQHLDGDDLCWLVPAAELHQPRPLILGAVERAREQLTQLATASDGEQQKAIVGRLLLLIQIAGVHGNADGEPLLLDLVRESSSLMSIKSTPGGADLLELATRLLSQGSAQAVEFLLDHKDELPADSFGIIFLAARAHLAPERLFELFSSYLAPPGKKRSPDALRAKSLVQAIYEPYQFRPAMSPDAALPTCALDPRWTTLAIEKDLAELVCALATSDYPDLRRLHDYLAAKWDAFASQKRAEPPLPLAQALLNSQHPDGPARILAKLKDVLAAKTRTYEAYRWIVCCQRLPASEIPALEALVADPKMSDAISQQLLDTIQTIRERTASNLQDSK